MAGTADGFGTTTAEMARAAAHVEEVNASVTGELASLRSKLEPLAGALWKGQAAVEFAKVMHRWDEDARRLNEALQMIGGSLGGAQRTYEQSEQNQSQSMSRIASALG